MHRYIDKLRYTDRFFKISLSKINKKIPFLTTEQAAAAVRGLKFNAIKRFGTTSTSTSIHFKRTLERLIIFIVNNNFLKRS